MAHPFIEHLLEDHAKQRTLAKRLQAEQSPERRDEGRHKLAEELLPHMAGEEASIFTFMRESGDEEVVQDALEAIEEHHVARTILREIMDLTKGSTVFEAKVTVLSEVNEHHMSHEEDEYFKWLEANASAEQIDELFETYKAAEKREEG